MNKKEIIKQISACFSDPMWANHAEVPKVWLKAWLNYLHHSKTSEGGVSGSEAFAVALDAAKGEAKPLRFFVYDPAGNNFEYYGTDAERAKAHAEAIAAYRAEAIHENEWPLEVESIVSGVVTHETVEIGQSDGSDYASGSTLAESEVAKPEKDLGHNGFSWAHVPPEVFPVDVFSGLVPAPEVTADDAQWQPIETAPKDGTEIIVFHEQAGVCAAFCPAPDYAWHCMDGQNTRIGKSGTSIPTMTSFVNAPTYWMPLPKPPIDAALTNKDSQ